MPKPDILKKIVIKRVEDEARGVKRSIKISGDMRKLIEKNHSSCFSRTMPFAFHVLSFNDDSLNAIFISDARVLSKDSIFIPLKCRIKGRASLLVCRYFLPVEDTGTGNLLIKSIPVEKMKGWQFKGFVENYGDGIILHVDEIYCAISGKKLQETPYRYNEKLIKGIVRFFYMISGNIAFSIANEVLKKMNVRINKNFSIEGDVSRVNHSEIVVMLLDSFSRVFGAKLSKNVPLLLETLREELRTKPVQRWLSKH